MHITVDITHPAHFHFFKHAIAIWQNRGDHVTILARDKDITIHLLEHEGLPFDVLTTASSGLFNLSLEMVKHSTGVWNSLRKHKSDVAVAIAGTFIVQGARLQGIPSVVFYDTEYAHLSNLITYPLATHIHVPRAYSGKLSAKFTRYDGYHELAYLHPDIFTPNPEKLKQYNLNPSQPYILIRHVARNSHHDYNDYGIIDLGHVVKSLEPYGQIVISSEMPLPPHLQHYGIDANFADVHHVLAHASLYFGDSATMASEAAQLGVPAIFLSHGSRGYTDELEQRYGLVFNFNGNLASQDSALQKAVELLSKMDKNVFIERRLKMLGEQINVTEYIVKQVDTAVCDA